MLSARLRSALLRRARIAPFLLPAVAIGLSLPLVGAWQHADSGADAIDDPGTLAWLLDLAAHWQFLYALLWLGLCLLCALRGRRWLLLTPFALMPLWTASPALPRAAPGDAPSLRVAVANVNLANRDSKPFVAWLRAQPADVVAILELTPAYAEALEATLGEDYPHRAFAPDASPFGIGLLSRRPLRSIERRDSADGIPQLRAILDDEAGEIRIVAVHPMPPVEAHWHGERDRLLRALADEAAETAMPTIVLGDLNATPWSSALFLAGQRGLFRASGFAPTWPKRYAGIAIDHALATAHWRRGERARGPDIGSDHLPLRVVLHRRPAADIGGGQTVRSPNQRGP